MTSAPFLRVVWTSFGPIFPDHVMLTNLGIGTVMSGVVMPAGGAVAFLLTHRRSQPGPPLLPRRAYVVAMTTLTVGVIVFWLRFRALGAEWPAAYGLAHVVPAVALTALCLAGANRARRAAAAAHERRWMWIAYAAAASPAASSVLGFFAAIVYGPGEGLAIGAALGPAGTILPAFALVVHRASRPARPSTPRTDDVPARPSLRPDDAAQPVGALAHMEASQ